MYKVELKLEFNNCKLQNVKEDPEVWLTELELLQSRLKTMGHVISMEDTVIHILNNLPKEYENTVESLEGQVSTVTIDEVKQKSRIKYLRLKKY